MGLSLAKYGEITFKDGKVQQGNFDDFPVIRMDEAPLVTNVYIVPAGADTPPSGVGEPGVPPFAPALINAIFAATGKRIRALADRQATGGVRRNVERYGRFHRSDRSQIDEHQKRSHDARGSPAVGRPSFERAGGECPDQLSASTTATRPAKTPPDQTSIPNAGPPATTTQTTGEASRDPTIKKMNEDEKAEGRQQGQMRWSACEERAASCLAGAL